MKEYLLTTNAYKEPASLEGSDAYAILLLRLLLLEPGSNPLHPMMGVGLGPKYRYMPSSNLPNLQSLIQEQVNTYLPLEFADTTSVFLTMKEGSKFLLITIIADNTKFVLDTEKSSVPIEITDII